MQPRTILIADDETHIVSVMTSKFQHAGFAVVSAGDGAEAYELARSIRPAVVITDCQMPRLSGPELCAKLSSDPLTCDVPVVLLTGLGFERLPGAKTGNIRRVVDKPFSLQALVDVVHEALAGEEPALSASATGLVSLRSAWN